MADQIISWSVQAGQKKYSLRNPKEIFIWEIGEPIEVQFRWASDSPFVPVAPLGEYGRYTVSDRTATFRFNSDWALFDLLRQHSAGGDPYDSVALRFEMDVVGSERRATSKAFVTLQALDGGGALELDLPTTAPSLPAKSERSGSVATSTGFAK
jgi:type VI protein secretion system component VasK